jgi:O-acetyl-ADP-ribose deacetylase (regulator of RNase III)
MKKRLLVHSRLIGEEVRTLFIHQGGYRSISTGIYGYPAADAAPVALQTVIDYLHGHPEIQLVRFVLWPDNLEIYGKALRQLAGS